MRFTHTLLLLSLITSLCTACLGEAVGTNPLFEQMSTRIWDLPYDVHDFAPNAPEVYKKGWVDGCKTGISMYGNTMLKTFYSFTLNPELRSDKTYNRIWHNARSYCRSYTNRTLAGDDFSGAYPSAFGGGRDRNFQSVTSGANNYVFGIPLTDKPESLNLFHSGMTIGNSWGSESSDTSWLNGGKTW